MEQVKAGLSKIDDVSKKKRAQRFILSAMSSIPWVGGLLSGYASIKSEREQGKINEFHELWLEQHEKKIEELIPTLFEILEKMESFGHDSQQRLESEEYLILVKKGFKEWDNAETEEKRIYIKKLLSNAGSSIISADALIRLYIDWIRDYHESHFAVIKEIYQNEGITRGGIWDNISDQRPREDSLEADLFKLLIRDLSTGGIIRQFRERDYYGNFVTKTSRKPKSSTLKSAFDDNDGYELTELGKQFVHYTMEDVLTRLD